jgi:uncharacterized protein (TIGR03790 family)
MRLRTWWHVFVLSYTLSSYNLLAGGSSLNVLVVVNPNSPNSLELGNYYCERRQVPPQNVVRLRNWTGGNLSWSRGQCQASLLNPLLEALAARRLDRQIDFVLLSMDIPYQVTEAGSVNSTTSVLFYSFKPDTTPVGPVPPSCSLPSAASNSYAFSEAVFRDAPPDTAPRMPFLAMMITGSTLAQAKFTVDQGVASDGTFPTQTVYLANTFDGARAVRSVLFDDAIFDTRVQDNYALVRVNQDSPYGLTNLLGYQTGLVGFSILPNAFVPGAMADNLTSFGGVILQPNGQTTVLAFLSAGASGSYGTVVEPCNWLEKFPSPRNYFYQARGFSLAECYYQSLCAPFQGLLVGEPLAAPFARRGTGSWNGLPPAARLTGMTNLTLRFTAADSSHPLQRVDLFLDGTFLQTVTNVPPAEGNHLSVTLNGFTADYAVPADATVRSVAAGLADRINAGSNVTHIVASSFGDRIALCSTDAAKSGDQIPVTTSAIEGANAPTTFVTASRSQFLDTVAFASLYVTFTNALKLEQDWMQLDVLKTNGVRVTLQVTNTFGRYNISPFILSLMDRVNSHAALQTPDGVVAEDFLSLDTSQYQFKLRARTPGSGGARIQVVVDGTPTLLVSPGATNRLDSNLSDLQPRNHLYVTAGVTNLAVTFPLDTTPLADGYHELTAVAYEGSHVWTQTRITQPIIVSNTPLSAVFATVVGDTNAAVEAALGFSVTANTDAVASIELFSTGGSLGIVTNQASGTFSILGTNLGGGLHPFYAIVTAVSGAQYRTETKWIRLVSIESPFALTITGIPPLLSWPALAGRRYDILSADGLTNDFQLRQTVQATNAIEQWRDDAPNGSNRFYWVRSAP